MAKLVDALVSGTSSCKVVQVRVLFRAQINTASIICNVFVLMKIFRYYHLLLFGAFSSICTSLIAQKPTRPNILIILADDLGHGDLSCTGGLTPTPNIDRIFSQGTRFSNFMTYTVSSPTRAGLLTGLNPLRTGQGPQTDGNLDPAIMTIGRYFQNEGYKTGIFGKWHNSHSPRKEPGAIGVNKYGFDRFVGFYGGGIDYYKKNSSGWFHDDKLVEDELDYSTDLIATYAIEFMDKSKNSNNPFLCYVPFNAVHNPHTVKEETLSRVPASIKEKAISYSAVIISLDDNVGRIMDYLEKTNQLENTIVLFFSDNGGAPEFGNNFPFRGFKHTIFEGGVHSAAAVIIPKTVLPNAKKDVTEMCGYLDVFPTLAALTKSKQPLPKFLDGVSIVDNLKGIAKPQTDRYYYWLWRNHDVLRSDKWKLFRYYNKVELYDMVNDISETKDVAASNPEVVKQFLRQIEVEARKMGAANSHTPLNIKSSNANPQGIAIAIDFDIKSQQGLKKQTLFVINNSFNILPDYYIEYDIKVDSKASLSYCYFSPLKGNKSIFDSTFGVDQEGHLLQSPTIFDNNWKHVAVGIGTFAPRKYGQFGITYKFNSPGKATVYLDNIVIKNLKGEIIQEIFVDKSPKRGFKSKNISIVYNE